MSAKPDCKSCKFYWTHGVKGTGHDRWCTKFSKVATKAHGQCKLKDGYAAKESQEKVT